MRKALIFCIFGLGIFLIPGAANADGLIGDTVGTRYFGASDDSGVLNTVVGAGEDGNFFSNQFYDYGDFSFQIRSIFNFCGILTCDSNVPVSLELSSLNFPGPLTSVILSTTLTGVSFVFDASSVTFTWNEQPLPVATYLTATFNSDASVVPLPAALPLFAGGLGLLGWMARRRRGQSANA